MPDRYSGTENYRANQQVKSQGANSVSGSGSGVGGTDSPRVSLTVKSAGNKSGGPEGGPDVGGTTTPGHTYKEAR